MPSKEYPLLVFLYGLKSSFTKERGLFMRAFTLLLLPLILLVGCGGPRYGDFFEYHDDGTVKPKVTLLPIRSNTEDNRELAQYLDQSIRYTAMDHGQLFLYSQDEINPILEKNGELLAKKDYLKLADCFHPSDFVVEMDVVQDEIVPYSPELKNCFIPMPTSSSLMARVVKLRLRVIDIRSQEPKIVLYEVIEQSQLLSAKDERRKVTNSIYEKLVDQTETRLEEVIWCAR